MPCTSSVICLQAGSERVCPSSMYVAVPVRVFFVLVCLFSRSPAGGFNAMTIYQVGEAKVRMRMIPPGAREIEKM